MRRLKVNKKSLLQKGGTSAPQMTMDTDSILQGIREKLQGGISEIEVFQNLMEQQIPLDEIQTAFTALGYDDTMLSNIMTKIQETTDKSSENIQEGNISGSSLPQAQAGNIGITPGMAFSGALQMPTSGFFGTVSTANTDQVTGFRPAKNFYLPQDLGNYGNVDGALGVLAQGFQNLFSKQDTDGDGLMDGTFRDTKAKRLRQKDRRGSYYDYEVTFDEGDSADNYYASNQDLFKGKLRTKEQAAQDFLDNSRVNYNVNTGQYETVFNPYQDKFLNSANNQLKNRLSKNKDLSGPMLNVIKDGISFSDFQQRLADNPAHAELLAQDLGIIKGDRLPAGVSYGVDKDGSAGSYFGANPYLYETMMLDNVYSGDASKKYQLNDFNLKGTSLRSGNTNTPSNTNTSSGFDYSNSPVVNKDDFVQGRQYTPLSSLTGNPSDKGFIDTTDYIQGNQTSTSSAVSSSAPVNITNDYSYLDPTLNTMFDFEQTLGGFNKTTGKAYGLSNLGANRYTSLDPSDPNYLDPKDPNFRANLRERVKRDYGSSLQGFDQSMQPAMLDFAYNTGRDPRIYLLDQYIKSQGNPAGLDNRGAYKDAMDNFSWTDANLQKNFNQVYGDKAAAISALPVADQIKLMNQGRQFYYNNINMVGGKPNPAAAATWLKRPFYKEGGIVDVGGGSIDMGKIDSRSINAANLDGASIQQAQFGFDLKGYFSGEQGLIPDYGGKSTTQTYMDNKDTVQNVLDKASYVPVLGTAASLGSAAIDVGDAYMAYRDGDYDTMKQELATAGTSAVLGATPGGNLVKAGYKTVAKNIAKPLANKTLAHTFKTGVKSGTKEVIKSGRGYELPEYQSKGEVTSPLTNVAKNVGYGIVSPFLASPDLVNKISDINLAELEGRVNEALGYTMNRGAQMTDYPGYKKFLEAESKYFESDAYQDLTSQIDSEYAKDEPDEDKIDSLYDEINSMERKFYESKIGKMGSSIHSFYSENSDPLRHGTTSGVTAKAISDKIKNVPYIGGLLDFVGVDDVGGVVGANLMGAGHEASVFMDDDRPFMTKLKESGKDMYNNFLGSLASIGSDSDEEVARKVIAGIKEGKYTSGMVPVALPNKQDGGANTLYEYYTGMGQDLPSISDRGTMFQDAGLGQQYSGTAAQNTQLLSYLQDPANTEAPDPTDVAISDDEIAQNIELDEVTVTAPSSGVSRLEPIGIQPIEVDPPDMQLRGVLADGTIANQDPTDPTDPNFKKPKIKRKNKLMGAVNRIKDSEFVKKVGDVSGLLVAGAGVVNEMFQNRKARKAKETLESGQLTMADKVYGMVEEREGDRGGPDENTGIMQPDNMIGYSAQMGTETFMMPPIQQEADIVDLDYETVAKLISAGADIEIL